MSIDLRPYKEKTDLDSMVHLIEQLRKHGQKVYPIAADLYEELADSEVKATCGLWEKNGQLVGFAYINRYQNIVDAFLKSEFTSSVQEGMMDWLVEAAKQRNEEKGKTMTLDASSLEDDLPRLAMLERFNFMKQPESSILLACPLGAPLPPPLLPPGFEIRPMLGESEIESYVALHRAAFGTENMDLDYRRSIMSTPGYLPELDLVAVAPNGELAAFCMCQIFEDDSPRAGGIKEGWTDPVGTHPAYRKQGLAKALILTGMNLLKGLGIDTAIMGTSSTNEGMRQVAEKIGFHVVSNTLWFSKNIG